MDDTASGWKTRAEKRFAALLEDIAADWSGRREQETLRAVEAGRGGLAESLNQGLRRLRKCGTPEELARLTAELTEPYASRCAVFLFEGNSAEAAAMRGLGSELIRFVPDEGAAFRTAIESQDPVIAVALPSEISRVVADRVGSEDAERVYLFPLTVRGEVRCVLFAAGDVQPAVLELICGMTAAGWEALSAPATPKRGDLLTIGAAEPVGEPEPRGPKSWGELQPSTQALHLRAQRNARLRVAEMRLEHGDALRRGLQQADLYGALRETIDAAREEFRRDFISASPTMVDYLCLEIVRELAQNNEKLLGINFPGPLV